MSPKYFSFLLFPYLFFIFFNSKFFSKFQIFFKVLKYTLIQGNQKLALRSLFQDMKAYFSAPTGYGK